MENGIPHTSHDLLIVVKFLPKSEQVIAVCLGGPTAKCLRDSILVLLCSTDVLS